MRRRKKIGDVPEWQRRLVFIVGWLAACTVLLVIVWAVLLFIE